LLIFSKNLLLNFTFCDVPVHAARGRAEAQGAEPDEAQGVAEQHDAPVAVDDLPEPDCGLPVASHYDGPPEQDYESPQAPPRDAPRVLPHDSPPVHALPLELHCG